MFDDEAKSARKNIYTNLKLVFEHLCGLKRFAFSDEKWYQRVPKTFVYVKEIFITFDDDEDMLQNF